MTSPSERQEVVGRATRSSPLHDWRARAAATSPSTENTEKGLCHYFLRTGTCKFGDSCKFNHDNSSKPAQTLADSAQTLNRLRVLLKNYKRLNFIDTISQFENFTNLALIALDASDLNIRSHAVAEISDAENGGLDFIRFAVEKMSLYHHPFGSIDFVRHVVPLIKVISHNAFTQSCVEKNLSQLVKVVYGYDGERGARFLKMVIRFLEQQMQEASASTELPTAQENCLLVSSLFYHLVRYNLDATAHEELTQLHAQLLVLFNDFPIAASPLKRAISRTLSETIAYLQPITFNKTEDTANRILAPSINDQNYSHFESFQDLPGDLSRRGPRHDNDSALISKISVLPTKQEFLSDRSEYLPINDITASHFLEGPARLFDTHFRLLREDMLGCMRGAISIILSKLRPKGPISQSLRDFNHRPSSALAGTRLYYNVVVESAKFDKKRGLVFQLRFNQPRNFQSVPAKKRIEYWETIRSLEKDSLISLVSNSPGVECFLTVFDKNAKALGQDKTVGHIEVTAAAKDDSSQEYLLNCMFDAKRMADSLLLVEFPGVMLVAYRSILECLQQRFGHPYLPFSHLLCPASGERRRYDSKSKTVLVEPPSYATSAGFMYDLRCLKRDQNSEAILLLSPYSTVDDLDLVKSFEAQTNLDTGQCRGLIAGLTQELALVQGLSFLSLADI